MTGLARFTAIIFVLLGVLLFVTGGGMLVMGLAGARVPALAVPGLAPNLSGLLVFVGAIAGGIVALQGLVLAAVGQMLWLMAGITDRAQLSVEYLAEAVNRLGNARH